ncbi:hypothetical protein AB0C52_08690 [Streptomyces sp. NPDC048717]|uniref:hypothetical protein n=1 Tax=unclassified Streptomyces TaxID=2593676 RepID=UPI0034334A52
MPSIRTARVLAVAAALPLAAVLFGGVALADDGGFASDGSDASAASVLGSGVVGENDGNSTTTQQVATGPAASNENHTANVSGSAFTEIKQPDKVLTFSFF